MPNLALRKKDAIVSWYMLQDKDSRGYLFPGKEEQVAKHYRVTTRTIRRIIREYKLGHVPMNHTNVPHHAQVPRGHPVSHLTDEARVAMYEVAQRHLDDQIRCTDRRLTAGMKALGFNHSRSTIQRWKKQMGGKYKRSYLKPSLNTAQKEERLVFVNAQKEPNGQLFENPRNKVHIDETWYYLDRECVKLLVFPGQEITPRRVSHKSHITKVMVVTAVGYPHRRPDGSFFDGKIGMWAVTEQVPAARSSKNRPAGTLETKPVIFTSEFYKNLWQQPNGIRAGIRRKLYHRKTSGIIIQQDGATPHTGCASVDIINAYIQQGNWNCTLITQPAQSPDLNLLDLGLFHGMKSEADGIKGDGRNIDTCIQRMKEAFASYDPTSIEINWGVLFEVYRLILQDNGNNSFKVPHSGVRRRGRVNQEYVDRNIN